MADLKNWGRDRNPLKWLFLQTDFKNPSLLCHYNIIIIGECISFHVRFHKDLKNTAWIELWCLRSTFRPLIPNVKAKTRSRSGICEKLPKEREQENRNGIPLQCPCLEISMGREAWQATVHGVTKSWTQPSNAPCNFWFPKFRNDCSFIKNLNSD